MAHAMDGVCCDIFLKGHTHQCKGMHSHVALSAGWLQPCDVLYLYTWPGPMHLLQLMLL